MKEKEHVIKILNETIFALKNNESSKLQQLSNETIHSASIDQHTDSITIAIIIYTLSKIISRRPNLKIKNWNTFIKKLNGFFYLAIKSLEENDSKNFNKYLQQIRKEINNISINLKQYIKEVFRKSSINKASKLYEHGLSRSQTAKLLGITEWELSEYVGQKSIHETPYNLTLNTKKRAKMAMEFFE